MGDWGEEILPEVVGIKWKKWTRGEGEGKEKYKCFTPSLPLHQSFTGQASKMAASKTLFAGER